MDWPKLRTLRTVLRARLDELPEDRHLEPDDAGQPRVRQDWWDAVESTTMDLARELPQLSAWRPTPFDLDSLVCAAQMVDRTAAAYLGRDELTTEERETLALELGLPRDAPFPDLRAVLLGAGDLEGDEVSSSYSAAWMNQVFHLLHGRSPQDQDTAADALAFVMGAPSSASTDKDPVEQIIKLIEHRSAKQIETAVDALRTFLDELDARKAGH